jgi:ppGpp synthetase/RelA/SpoT-type nucleotidyltranferase
MENLLDKYKAIFPKMEELANYYYHLLSDFIIKKNIKLVDNVKYRVKTPESFIKKAQKVDQDGNLKYSNPIVEIQDIIGLRIVVRFLQDVELVYKEINKLFNGKLEEKKIEPSEHDKFSYEGKHFIFRIPQTTFKKYSDKSDEYFIPHSFELQILTLYQHSWATLEHDLTYKAPSKDFFDENKRLMAFLAAQTWGTDKIFQDTLEKALEASKK